MTSRAKLVLVSSIIFAVIVMIVLIISTVYLADQHEKEINRIIEEQSGTVLEIKKVLEDDSPFAGSASEKYNVIYKVRYAKEENEKVAWYRATNTVNNIHSQQGYGEKWIFE